MNRPALALLLAASLGLAAPAVPAQPAEPAEPLPEGDEEAGRWYTYHRADRPCLRCGTPIREKEVAARRLFWCPSCQPRHRRRRANA